MTDIKISTEETSKESKPVDENNIKEILKSADEYQKLKEENDKFEAEIIRKEELKARMDRGGRALAGKPLQKNDEELAKEEAARILSMFR